MRLLRFLLRFVGWLLTPLVAWAASFFGAWLGRRPPDAETRLAILRKKAQLMHVDLPEETLNFLAQRIRTNIRRLEGALVRVASYASLTGHRVTLEVVENLLREVLHEEGRFAINIETIQKRVAEHFDIRLADMAKRP